LQTTPTARTTIGAFGKVAEVASIAATERAQRVIGRGDVDCVVPFFVGLAVEKVAFLIADSAAPTKPIRQLKECFVALDVLGA